MWEFFEGAHGAFWFWLAVVLAESDQQGVVFVEQLHLLRQTRLEQFAQLLISGVRLDELMAAGNAGGIGVDDKNAPFERVEQYGVGCFRTYAFYGQKLTTQSPGVEGFEVLQLALVFDEEPIQETLEAFSLEVVVAGGANKLGQLFGAEVVKLPGAETVGAFEVVYCLFNVCPACVLRQYCTNDNLELCVAGPPVLRAEGLEK